MKTTNALLAVLVLALGATQLSCSVNDYCLNCGTSDGGNGDDDANDGGDGDATDAPPDMAICVPDGTEVCDGKDNDCNGLTDDGVLPEVGDQCANQMGACQGGTKICSSGHIVCDKQPMPEACNDIDDNCNGDVDEGDPGGGALCGTQAGACVAGTERCVSGSVQCVGFQDHTGDPELCNGQDDDCDGNIDDNIGSLGTCGPPANQAGKGICVAGTLQCTGGVPTCTGAVFAKFETCNHVDDDCDDVIDDGFDTANDPNNCGDCVGTGFTGVVCQPAVMTCVNGTNPGAQCSGPNAVTCVGPGAACVTNSRPICSTGQCDVACNAGFYDLNNSNIDGCEYKCSPTGPEVCDGIDNDCDGLVDSADGSLQPPPANLCNFGGECSVGQATPTTRPAPTCDSVTAKSWVCNYLGDVGEETCDNKNNDCDANTDETYPLKGTACSDKEPGKCLDTGTLGCAANETSLQCNYTTNNPDLPTPGQPLPGANEDCNAVDDDCDSKVDENVVTGRDWVTIGGGVQMMQYEASRPDATGSAPGVDGSTVCSRPGVQPWATLTYTQAEAACTAIGARLCTESEWHRTCSVVASSIPGMVNTAGTLIETEDYTGIAFATGGSPNRTRAWVTDNTLDFSGIADMEATSNTGGNITIGNAAAQAPRLDYKLNFQTSGNYTVYVRMFAASLNDDTVYVGLSGTTTPVAPTTTVTTLRQACATSATCPSGTVCVDTDSSGSADTCTPQSIWQWRQAAANVTVTGTGDRLLSIYMGKDGVKIDQIWIVAAGGAAPPNTINGKGGTWAFLTNPTVYSTTTCNGDDLDTNAGTAGDQDDILATHSLLGCAANVGTGVFDMSGNVKEWTKAHQPGENPIRGGASNNSATGISCALNFTLADNTLKLPNIGFRCCK